MSYTLRSSISTSEILGLFLCHCSISYQSLANSSAQQHLPDESSLSYQAKLLRTKSIWLYLFSLSQPYNANKLEYRSTPCTLLGYNNHHKGYKCLSHNGRLYISRHVKFDEQSFLFTQLSASSLP